MLQGLHAAAVRPFGGRGVTQEILRHAEREPEGEDPLAPRAAADLGQEPEKRARRRIPPAHASTAQSASKTVSGAMARMQR